MLTREQLTELIGLLETRVAVVKDTELREQNPEEQLAKLQEVSEAIVAFHATHRSLMRPRLNHFLENFSLEKAHDWAKAELAKAEA